MKKMAQFLRDEDGPTTVEYAVMLALILAACLTGISFFGQETSSSFDNSANQIEAAVSAGT